MDVSPSSSISEETDAFLELERSPNWADCTPACDAHAGRRCGDARRCMAQSEHETASTRNREGVEKKRRLSRARLGVCEHPDCEGGEGGDGDRDDLADRVGGRAVDARLERDEARDCGGARRVLERQRDGVLGPTLCAACARVRVPLRDDARRA
eukprot:2766677-Pleurochrysis_carterae.AAC.2